MKEEIVDVYVKTIKKAEDSNLSDAAHFLKSRLISDLADVYCLREDLDDWYKSTFRAALENENLDVESYLFICKTFETHFKKKVPDVDSIVFTDETWLKKRADVRKERAYNKKCVEMEMENDGRMRKTTM